MTLSRHQDKPQQLWRHLEVPLQYLAMSKSIFLIVSVTIVLALVSFPCSKCPPCPDAVLQGQLSHLLKAIRKATRWLSWYGVGLASADRLPVVVRIPAGPLGSLKCDPPKGNGRRPKKNTQSHSKLATLHSTSALCKLIPSLNALINVKVLG